MALPALRSKGSFAPAAKPRVLVVGAGPAGLVAAITLAHYAVSVLLVEKREAISTLSRALVISTRGMELLRSWGLEDQVRAGAADVKPCAWVTASLASGTGTEMSLGYPTDAQAARLSPTRPAWAPQDHLEQVLRAHLQAASSAEIRTGCELIGLEQHRGTVCARLRDRQSGRTEAIETLFVLGADGAHSTVRQQLGIRMVGSDDLAEYHRVEFHLPLAAVVGDRRYGLYVITHPDVAGVLASCGPGGRWALSWEWRPGQERLIDQPEKRLVELIASAVGLPGLRPRIERVSSFSFAAQTAEHYRERQGFLIGDAAHRMTPRGGTGMNTAIQDAYDLGWKLAWVLRGWAAPDLLDSYEAERRPVGAYNVARSAEPNGAQRPAGEALAWDLNGRLRHRWLRHAHKRLSTLDLLGDGLTLLAGPSEPDARDVLAGSPAGAPVAQYVLEEAIARSVGVPPGGAIVVRPDGQRLRDWPKLPTAG